MVNLNNLSNILYKTKNKNKFNINIFLLFFYKKKIKVNFVVIKCVKNMVLNTDQVLKMKHSLKESVYYVKTST